MLKYNSDINGVGLDSCHHQSNKKSNLLILFFILISEYSKIQKVGNQIAAMTNSLL